MGERWNRQVHSASRRWTARVMDGDAPSREHPIPVSQFPVYATALIPRSRSEVWAELAADDHPAWSEPGPCTHRCLEGTPSFAVGAASVSTLPPSRGMTHRTVLYSEIIAIVPLVSVTTELLWLVNAYVKTLSLRDTIDGQTLATVAGTLSVPGDNPGGAQAAQRFTRLAEVVLARAAEWRPGDPPRSSAIPFDPANPL